MFDLKEFEPLKDPDLQSIDVKLKKYIARKCIILQKINEPFGHLLNMSSRYPIVVNDVKINSIEALYQALKYPEEPTFQKKIIEEPNPFLAKKIVTTDHHWHSTRENWHEMRVKIMRWCLQVKLACHYDEVGALLDQTDNKDLVETSPDGYFWGAYKFDALYVGANVFGQLLMELRQSLREKTESEIKDVRMDDIINSHQN